MKINSLMASNSAHWLVLFLGVLGAWCFLYTMSMSTADPSIAGNVVSDMQVHSGNHGMHDLSAGDAAIVHLFGMWAIKGEQIDADALSTFCKEYLESFKTPKKVVFRELPKTATGKIQKFKLRERVRSR